MHRRITVAGTAVEPPDAPSECPDHGRFQHATPVIGPPDAPFLGGCVEQAQSHTDEVGVAERGRCVLIAVVHATEDWFARRNCIAVLPFVAAHKAPQQASVVDAPATMQKIKIVGKGVRSRLAQHGSHMAVTRVVGTRRRIQ